MYRHYLFILLLLFALCMPPLAASYFYLRNSGELERVEDIAERQATSPDFCLVGTAIHEDFYTYKLALYKEYHADVVALGSSRVMQFRESYFKVRFLNMGGSLTKLSMSDPLLKVMLAIHKPRLVILGLDYWWFNERVDSPTKAANLSHDRIKLDFGKLLQPYQWIKDGKLHARHYLAMINPFYSPEGPCRIGVSANNAGRGFGPDGSYYYADTITGQDRDFNDRHFASSTKRVHAGSGRFEPYHTANNRHVEKLRRFADDMAAADIDLVMFLPPVSPTLSKEIAKQKDNDIYMQDLRGKLKAAGLHLYDFHEPSSLNTTDCEFIDGFHGGEVVYARILDAIIQSGNRELEAVVNYEQIKTATQSASGLAMLPDKRITSLPEVDFLDIGCNK